MTEPLLIHSLAEFATVTLPALELAQARHVCEIGAEHGGNTAVLVPWLEGRGGLLTSIDPAPSAAFGEWLADHASHVRHVKRTSLEAIPTLDPQDAWFIDGDHNWYTVYHELKAIEAHAARYGKPFLVFLHDVGWPCARRDQYYDPKRIPTEFLHPNSFDCGVVPGSALAVFKRGFRGEGAFSYAIKEGGARNGVLTAIEDFNAECATPMFWAEIPCVFGLGVLFSRTAPWADALAGHLRMYHDNPILARLEQNRLQNYLAVIDYQDLEAQRAAAVVKNLDAAPNREEKGEMLGRKFCSAPFRKFETLIDGTVAPCCSIWTDLRLGNIDQQNFEQIWNSDKAQEMRASILDGSFRHCKKDRCELIINDRLPDRDSVVEPHLRSIIDNDTTYMERGPEWLFLGHDVTCNLACPSGRSGILAADEAQEARFRKIEQQVLQPMVRPGQPMEISVSGQGDPWSSPHYRSFLRFLADHDHDIELNLHSNGLLLTRARWEQYQGLAKYRPLIDISIDACNPWTYANVRRPGDWHRLLPNLKFFGELHANGTFSEYHINTTVQLDNFHELGDMADLVTRIGADTLRLYRIQLTGQHISRDYSRKNIADVRHPLHTAFLESLRDARLGQAHVHLYDIVKLRDLSVETRLPSDDFSQDAEEDAIIGAAQFALDQRDALQALALATAARVRFPTSVNSRMTEAAALQALGFPWQATYRYWEVLAVVPDYFDARVSLATAFVETGQIEEGARMLQELSQRPEASPELRELIGQYLANIRNSPPQGRYGTDG